MRGRVAVVCALVVAAAVTVSARSPAPAVEGIESGYWWQAQPAGGSAPPPPQVPPGGLWVSGSNNGEVAISAVRFRIASNETAPVLTMKVHSSAPPGQLASAANAGLVIVVACPTTSSWSAVSAGPWSARPQANCNAGVHGAVSPDGTKISFDLGPLAVDGKVDVALQPGAGGTPVPAVPVPGAPAPPSADGFDITFEPVAADQVAVSPGLASNESSTPSDALPSVPESSAPFSNDVGNSTGSPTTDFNFAANALQGSTGTAGSSAPSVAPGSLVPQERASTEATPAENHGYRLLAVLLLAFLLWWAWRQAVPPRADRRTIYDGSPAEPAP